MLSSYDSGLYSIFEADKNDYKQGKSEGFDSCNWPSNLAQIGSKSNFLVGVTMKFDAWPWKMIEPLF